MSVNRSTSSPTGREEIATNLPGLAADLVRLGRGDIIVCGNKSKVTVAGPMKATTKHPSVMRSGFINDPVKEGLVASFGATGQAKTSPGFLAWDGGAERREKARRRPPGQAKAASWVLAYFKGDRRTCDACWAFLESGPGRPTFPAEVQLKGQ